MAIVQNFTFKITLCVELLCYCSW